MPSNSTLHPTADVGGGMDAGESVVRRVGEKERRIAVMPHHDDWAPGSGFILTSPVPKCFFPR